jgi:hypothetical protein
MAFVHNIPHVSFGSRGRRGERHLGIFYGNNIDVEKAWKCYDMCNESDDKTLIREGVKRYYNEWTESEVKKVPYYNMITKTLWINGDIGAEIPKVSTMLPSIRRFRDYTPETAQEKLTHLQETHVMRICMMKY